MPEMVYLNGRFIKAHEAKISVFDHGFLYGDGLFETMRAYNGIVFCLEEHLDRLYKSASALELAIPLSRRELTEAIKRIILLNGQNLYIRLTVSRGPGPIGIDPRLCPKPTVVITAKEITCNERVYKNGAAAVFVQTLRNLAGATMPEVKSLNFLNNILAKQELVKAGADEGFMLNYLGQVTEGTVSNVFIVNQGRLLTPDRKSGILEGITRAKVLELAWQLKIPAVEQILTTEDFAAADEVFYTNSGSEVVPVTRLDGQQVGRGYPGPVTLLILGKYRAAANAAEKQPIP